jgi:hypothetical protein
VLQTLSPLRKSRPRDLLRWSLKLNPPLRGNFPNLIRHSRRGAIDNWCNYSEVLVLRFYCCGKFGKSIILIPNFACRTPGYSALSGWQVGPWPTVSLFFLFWLFFSPFSLSLVRAFPHFLLLWRLARRASRPYCGSARRACRRRSVHSPRGPAHCRHCSRIRLRTPAIERRAVLMDFAHRAPSSSYKTAVVLLPSSSHLASLLLLLF